MNIKKLDKSRCFYILLIIITSIAVLWLSFSVSWGTEEDYKIVALWAAVLLTLVYLTVDFIFFYRLRGWKKALLILLSIIFILSGTEYLLSSFIRLFPRLYQPSASLIWENTPNLNAVEDEKHGFCVSTDPNGFRNRKISKIKKENQIRIMVLGDSTAFGWPFGDYKNFPWFLEKELRLTINKKDIRVINAAVSGYSSLQGKIFLQEKGWDFEPDILVIAFNNDPFIDINEDINRIPQGMELSIKKILYKSKLYVTLKNTVFPSRINPEDDLVIPPDKGKPRISPDLLKEIYQEILKEAAQRNIGVIILSLPVANRAIQFPGMRKYREIMEQTARENNVIFIDLFNKWNNSISASLFFDDIHPTVNGHQIIADELTDKIFDNNLLQLPESEGFKKGFALIRNSKPDKAVYEFSKILEDNPSSYKALYGMGKALSQMELFDRALEYYKKALEIFPDRWDVINDKGAVYHFLKDYEKAISFFKKSTESNILYYPAYDNLGFAFYYTGQYDKALFYFTESIELNPDFADSYMGRGKVYMEMHKIDESIKDLSKAISIDENLTDAYWARGLAYSDNLEYDKACSDLNKVLKIYPNRSQLYVERAIIYFWKGDFKESLNDIDTALEKGKTDKNNLHVEMIKSGYVDILRGLIKSKTGDDNFKEDIRRGLELFDRSEGVDYIFPGHAALLLKDYKRALSYFNRETEGDAHKYYGRAKAYLGLNQKKKALQDLEKASKLIPDTWEKQEAEILIEKLKRK